MTQFVQIDTNGARKLSSHPGWLIGDTPGTSRLLTPAELVAYGFGLEVIDNPPAYDPETQYPVSKDVDEWLVGEGVITKLYDIVDKPAPPTPELTPRQLRLGLNSIGITETQIDAALENDAEGFIEWKYATSYKRDHPLISQLGAAFVPPTETKTTDEQIDTLWVWAADR